MTDAKDGVTAPVVIMDEAGDTGENLLDPAQPVYALAAVHLPEADADRAVQNALTRTQMPELKFARLRSSNPGRRNMLQLLEDLALEPSNAAVGVAHKPYMVTLKMVDELVEPHMLDQGVQMAWYATGAARAMAFDFADQSPRDLGSVHRDLLVAFVALVRDCTSEAAASFRQALSRAKLVSTNQTVSDILSLMIDDEDRLRAEFQNREDALDPAIPLLFWQAVHWSKALGEPFGIVHDESNTVARWAHLFAIARSDAQGVAEATSEPIVVGEITIESPDQLRGITFGQSHQDARLQVADVVAGAAAHLYAVAAGARPADDFARGLQKVGVGALLQHAIGPAVA